MNDGPDGIGKERSWFCEKNEAMVGSGGAPGVYQPHGLIKP